MYNAVSSTSGTIGMKQCWHVEPLLALLCSVFLIAQNSPLEERKPEPPTISHGNIDILSDTMGVDFGPYLAPIKHDVKRHWLYLIPDVARPPISKNGVAMIDFEIAKNGQAAGMKLQKSSGDMTVGRAAWGGLIGDRTKILAETDTKLVNSSFH